MGIRWGMNNNDMREREASDVPVLVRLIICLWGPVKGSCRLWGWVIRDGGGISGNHVPPGIFPTLNEPLTLYEWGMGDT
jgi:hypothetical protein